MILILFFLGLVIIVLYIIYYGRQNYGKLENCGFPVISPTLFLGSDPFFYKKIQHFEDIKRYKKYGRIWGLYLGLTPQVYIADAELIRLILVKDNDHFLNRREAHFGSALIDQVLDYLPGEKWKTLRTALSPLFTTSKLRTMSGVIDTHAQEYMDDLKKECNVLGRVEQYDCKIRLTSWLIDMFAQCTLGIKLEDRKNPDNKFAYAFRKMIGEDVEYNLLHSLSMTFPVLAYFAPSFDLSQTDLIESTFRHILQTRASNGTKKANDFVDILNEIRTKVNTKEYKALGITELTVISQAVNFFLGGYETSSTTLSHFLYYMVKHTQHQQRIYEELKTKFLVGNSKIDHETIKEENLPLLTACLNECLRLAPPFRPERICTKEWKHNGIRIPKGTEIYVANWAAHRDPNVFEDPDEFKPERFLNEEWKTSIGQYALAAFGHGPRNCIGTRFAYDSIKTLLCHLLLNFEIHIRPDTEFKYKPGCTLLLSFGPLYVDMVKRN